MKIVHVCIVDAYSDGWNYHRNILSERNRMDGHEVTIITTKYSMRNDGSSMLDKVGVSFNSRGIKIVRLDDFVSFLPMHISRKLNWTNGLYEAIVDEAPDVIMVHNPQIFNLNVIARYKRKNKNVVLVGDTHADYNTSIGKNRFKSTIVQKLLWRNIIKKSFDSFDKFCYITPEAKGFFEQMYAVDLSGAQLTPLPGKIIEKLEKEKIRHDVRRSMKIEEDTLMFVHSGKLEKRKKTQELINALRKSSIKCKLVVIGEIPESNAQLRELLESDCRILYLGWKSGEELRDIITASDLYLQPGTMSITMQTSICVGTPVMLYPYDSYKLYSNGCEFSVKDEMDIVKVFDQIESNPSILKIKSDLCYSIAFKHFDVRVGANLIYKLVAD